VKKVRQYFLVNIVAGLYGVVAVVGASAGVMVANLEDEVFPSAMVVEFAPGALTAGMAAARLVPRSGGGIANVSLVAILSLLNRPGNLGIASNACFVL